MIRHILIHNRDDGVVFSKYVYKMYMHVYEAI